MSSKAVSYNDIFSDVRAEKAPPLTKEQKECRRLAALASHVEKLRAARPHTTSRAFNATSGLVPVPLAEIQVGGVYTHLVKRKVTRKGDPDAFVPQMADCEVVRIKGGNAVVVFKNGAKKECLLTSLFYKGV